MFCSNCGREIDPRAFVCVNCGAKEQQGAHYIGEDRPCGAIP